MSDKTNIIDEITFIADPEQNNLSFVETTYRRISIMPPIPLKTGVEYRLKVFDDERIVLEQNLSDGWKIVFDAPESV